MQFFLFALHYGWRLPICLIVVLMPLAILLSSLPADWTGGGVQRVEVQLQRDLENRDCRVFEVSAARWQCLVGTAGDYAAGWIPLAAWSRGKFPLTRPIFGRWASARGANSAGWPSARAVAGRLAPQAWDVSSSEYLMLRRLRL